MDDLDKLKSMFPARFQSLKFPCPPIDSYPQTKRVYRLCSSAHSLSSDDFIPSYQEKNSRSGRWNDVSSYSVSFLDTMDSVEKYQQKYPKLRNKRAVKGVIKKKYGFMRQKPKDPHCDLWLYEKAEPWIDFEMEELSISE